MALECCYGRRNPSGTAETPHRDDAWSGVTPEYQPSVCGTCGKQSLRRPMRAIDPRQRVLGRYNGARGDPTRADLAHTFSAVTRDRVLSRIYVGPDSGGNEQAFCSKADEALTGNDDVVQDGNAE